MADCLFCRIAGKELPAEIIYENDRIVAFLDITPKSPGHTMVVSRTHSETLLDLPPSEIGPLFSAVQRVTARLAEVLKPDGFTIGINHGSVSGQSIKHLHVHVMPRFEGDGGGSIHSVVDNPPSQPVPEIAKKVRITS